MTGSDAVTDGEGDAETDADADGRAEVEGVGECDGAGEWWERLGLGEGLYGGGVAAAEYPTRNIPRSPTRTVPAIVKALPVRLNVMPAQPSRYEDGCVADQNLTYGLNWMRGAEPGRAATPAEL